MTKQLSFLFLLLLFAASNATLLAQSKTPYLLHGPEDWIFERIDLPLGFAPEMKHEGFEELRFAEGWSKPNSDNYFNYLFVLSLEGAPKMKAKALVQLLEQYYRGLAMAVGEGKDFEVDPTRITVQLDKVKGRSGRKTYHAQVLFLDAFNGGEEVPLRMELEVSRNKPSGTTRVFALVCPQPFTAERWEELRRIRVGLKL